MKIIIYCILIECVYCYKDTNNNDNDDNNNNKNNKMELFNCSNIWCSDFTLNEFYLLYN